MRRRLIRSPIVSTALLAKRDLDVFFGSRKRRLRSKRKECPIVRFLRHETKIVFNENPSSEEQSSIETILCLKNRSQSSVVSCFLIGGFLGCAIRLLPSHYRHREEIFAQPKNCTIVLDKRTILFAFFLHVHLKSKFIESKIEEGYVIRI